MIICIYTTKDPDFKYCWIFVLGRGFIERLEKANDLTPKVVQRGFAVGMQDGDDTARCSFSRALQAPAGVNDRPAHHEVELRGINSPMSPCWKLTLVNPAPSAISRATITFFPIRSMRWKCTSRNYCGKRKPPEGRRLCQGQAPLDPDLKPMNLAIASE